MITKQAGETLMKRLLAVFIFFIAVLVIMLFAYFIKMNKEQKAVGDTANAASMEQTEDTSRQAADAFAESKQEAPLPSSPLLEDGADDDIPEQIEASPHAEEIDRLIENMSLHEKVCQMFICTPEGLTGTDQATIAGDLTYSSLTEYPIGGVIYFSQNFEDVQQTRDLISYTKQFSQEISGIPLFIGVDEEGGEVARCAEMLGTASFSPMFEYKDEGIAKAYANARDIAVDIAGLGFNLDFAPVADTWSESGNTVIGSRAYSDDFEETAELVSAAVQGFGDGGVCCVLKHFPGHGSTLEDSHYGSAYLGKTPEQLEKEEYLAFKSGILAGADMVMVGHITMTEVDELPASISPVMVTDELRGRLGYDGIVVTDSLAMAAVADNYSSGDLAIKAVKAGVDILLMPEDLVEAVESLKLAVYSGEISEDRIDESVKRILTLKADKLGLFK